MTKQEQWNEIVQRIDELGDELMELAEDLLEENADLESSLMGLRMSCDHLREQEV
jgi:hypothetical protein